jgi:hypothetical protein
MENFNVSGGKFGSFAKLGHKKSTAENFDCYICLYIQLSEWADPKSHPLAAVLHVSGIQTKLSILVKTQYINNLKRK